MMAWLSAAALVGVALNAGVLFAFSAFVMPALRAVDGATAATAMQSINRFAVHPPFMVLFFGTTLLCVGVLVAALTGRLEGRGWAIAGALLFLFGVFGVTAARNVPLNNALVAAPAGDAGAWAAYAGPWTAANHLRVATGVLAAAALAFALAQEVRG